MTLLFRFILIVVSCCVMFYILKKIREAKVQIEDSIFWILFSLLLVVISIVPQIADFFAHLLGIYSTVNFVFLLVIFVLVFRIFSMTIKMSQMDHKIRELVQEVAIKEKQKSSSGVEEEKND